jgi:adenylate cyclase
MVIGDVGSDQGLSFTVIGDSVNVASRLQSLTRTLATPLIISGDVVDAVRQGSVDEPRDLLDGLLDAGEQALRGRSSPVRIWSHPDPLAAPAPAG